MTWDRVATRFLDLFKTPTGLGLVAILALLLFLVYALPVGGLLYANVHGTDRIVGAIQDLKSEMRSWKYERRTAERP